MKIITLCISSILFLAHNIKAQTVYNANEAAAKLLKEGSYRRIDIKYANEDEYFSKSKIINNGKKDNVGNEINTIKLYLDPDNKLKHKDLIFDSLIIVPDFAPFPINYEIVNVTRHVAIDSYEKRRSLPFELESKVFIGQKTGAIFEEWRDRNGDAADLWMVYSQGKMAKKSVWEKEAEEWYKFFKKDNKDLQATLKAQWDAVKKFLDEQMLLASTSTYEAELKKFVDTQTDFRYMKMDFHYGTIGSFYTKLRGGWNKKGGLDTLKFQLPFTDTKYYDKPQFFSKSFTKNSEGLFNNIRQDKINFEDGMLVPFGGIVLVVNYEFRDSGVKQFRIEAALAPDELVPMARNILRFGTVHPSNMEYTYRKNNQGPFVAVGDIYVEKIKKDELITEFDSKLDPYNLEFFLPKYVNALMKKK